MERSFKPGSDDTLYLKMDGRKLYQYALSNVPSLVKKSLDKAGIGLGEVDKVLIHQANEKMDRAILDRLFKLYNNGAPPEGVMPMTIHKLGNTSVATVPTLLDLILRNKLDGHSIHSGETLVFASVGAGMNINSVVYRVPESDNG
jgi:3-oxoacyl-[acyl-carrier-protein] synthase-3